MSLRSMISALALLAVTLLACGSGGPEYRPGPFEKPNRTLTHGRFVEKHYTGHNGPSSVPYRIVEVDGKGIRIKDGYVQRTRPCAAPGTDAMALQVRGNHGAAGIYILQLDGDRQILEKICPFGRLPAWTGTTYRACNTHWDALAKRAVTAPPP